MRVRAELSFLLPAVGLIIGAACGPLEGEAPSNANRWPSAAEPPLSAQFGAPLLGLDCTGAPPFAVLLDPATLSAELPGVVAAAAPSGFTPGELINEDLATTTGNLQLRWSELYPGSLAVLPSEGVYALDPDLWGTDGPIELSELLAGDVAQDQLPLVTGVRRVEGAGLERLLGQRLVAIVHLRDLAGSDLSGPRSGRFDFTVLGLGPSEMTVRVEARTLVPPSPSGPLVDLDRTCPETPRVCRESWGDVGVGPVPDSCVKLTGDALGGPHGVRVGMSDVAFDAFTFASPGDLASFAWRSRPGEVLVSVRAGGQTHVDDGDGVFVHPDGVAAAPPIDHVVLCPCDQSAPPGASTCGNGILEPGEVCDDRGRFGGCAPDCRSVLPGWVCPTPGIPCDAAACGDGIIAGFEECEDDNPTPFSGDGCSDRCRLEPGFACDAAGAPCRPTVCGDGVREGLEACDDGNNDTGDGCTPFCLLEPDCADGACSPTCGDGVILPGEACDDGNRRSGDGCSETCEIEPGFACEVVELADGDTVELPIVYRDFRGWDLPALPDGRFPPHPDFQRRNVGLRRGVVEPRLGPGRLPVASDRFAQALTSPESFAQWYRDTEASLTVLGHLTFSRIGARTFAFDETHFFPMDGPSQPNLEGLVGMGLEPRRRSNGNQWHNFHFTSIVRHYFEYTGTETLTFRGDDDVWAFINGHLAVDLGGVHGPISGSVTLDPTRAASFGMVLGGVYEMVVFHAERHTSASNYRLTLVNFSRRISVCAPICGDGRVTPAEVCDDGINDGGYDGCAPGCLARGPYCGDGIVHPSEDCDHGGAPSPDCPAGCRFPCVFLDPSVCHDGPCRAAGASAECRSAMESYCSEHPEELPCGLWECASGAHSFAACEAAVERFCAEHPAEPGCR